MEDGTHGNMSQGKDVAYIECRFEDIKKVLQDHLCGPLYTIKRHPVIINAEHIKGHVIK